jgi:hypothetical protein
MEGKSRRERRGRLVEKRVKPAKSLEGILALRFRWGRELTVGCPVVVSPYPASGLACIDEVIAKKVS